MQWLYEINGQLINKADNDSDFLSNIITGNEPSGSIKSGEFLD